MATAQVKEADPIVKHYLLGRTIKNPRPDPTNPLISFAYKWHQGMRITVEEISQIVLVDGEETGSRYTKYRFYLEGVHCQLTKEQRAALFDAMQENKVDSMQAIHFEYPWYKTSEVEFQLIMMGQLEIGSIRAALEILQKERER